MPTTVAADAGCAKADDVCRRVAALEPSLPIRPPLVHGQQTPCLTGTPVRCLPYVHVLSGWHMLTETAVTPWLAQHERIELRERGCFGLWNDDGGASKWVESWGGPPPSAAHLIATTQCSAKLLTWHPEV